MKPLENEGKLKLPIIPKDCVHNAHIFYIKLKNLKERTKFISYLKEHEISSVFHYIPLHSAPAGLKYGRFSGEDIYTTRESECLTRLPIYYRMKEYDISKVITTVKNFFL